MSIEEDLNREREVLEGERHHDPKEPVPRLEWSGEEGTIQTGPKGPDFNPDDFSAVLHEFGLDSATHRLELIGGTKWLQSRRGASYKAESNRSVDGVEYVREFEDKWLYSFKYRFYRTEWSVHLPALYAEVANTKAKPPKAATGDATIVICWSDIQTGKVDYLGGMRELLERLDEKRDSLERYFKHHRKQHGFDHIVIADCGDIIEGFQNFDAQTRTNALSIMDQVDVAATELWKTIRLCAQYAPVDMLSIPSNHCRWAKGKSLIGKTTDDWGLHVSKRLERMNAEVSLPVKFHRAEEWMETLQFEVRPGIKLGLAHGHQVSNPDQIKTWWAKMTHAGVLDCDILVTGHFHFPSLRPSGRTQWRYGDLGGRFADQPISTRSKWHIQASTLDNGSAWVRNKYGDDGDPALTVFQINDDGFDVQSFALL